MRRREIPLDSEGKHYFPYPIISSFSSLLPSSLPLPFLIVAATSETSSQQDGTAPRRVASKQLPADGNGGSHTEHAHALDGQRKNDDTHCTRVSSAHHRHHRVTMSTKARPPRPNTPKSQTLEMQVR